MTRGFKVALRHPALSAFTLVYLLTCYVGSLALLLGPTVIRNWYVSRTAAQFPLLSDRDVVIDIVLLNVAPLLLVLGWWCAGLVVGRVRQRLRLTTPTSTDPFPPRESQLRAMVLLVAVLCGYLLVREQQGGAFHLLPEWFHYSGFVSGRGKLIRHLTESDFVIAYTVLPLLVGLLLSMLLRRSRPLKVTVPVAVLALGGFALVNVLLLQKRPLLIGILIIAFVLVLNERSTIQRAARRFRLRHGLLIGVGGVAGLYLLYALLLVAPLAAKNGTSKEQPVVFESEFAQLGPVGWTTSSLFLNAGARMKLIRKGRDVALRVVTRRDLQGASYATGTVHSGVDARLTIGLSAPSHARVDVLLGPNPSNYRELRLSPPSSERTYTLTWPVTTATPLTVAVRTPRGGTVDIHHAILREEPVAQARLPIRWTVPDGRAAWATAGPFLNRGASAREQAGAHPGLTVRSGGRDDGIVHAVGTVPARTSLTLRLTMQSVRGSQAAQVLLGSGFGSYAARTVTLGPSATTYTLHWRTPTPAPVFFAVRTRGRGGFTVSEADLASGGTAASHRTTASSRPGVTAARAASTAQPRAWLPVAAVRFPSIAESLAHNVSGSLGLLAVLAPSTRTAGPAIAYPALFPHRHGFYAIDLGLWVAGITAAPNDNVTSFQLLFPSVGAGTNSVPFMFVLYAQGGLVVALLGALIIGALWRIAWSLAELAPARWLRSCLLAILIIFGVYIAQDSAVNAVFVSYGIFWPVLLACAAAAALGGWARIRARRTA